MTWRDKTFWRAAGILTIMAVTAFTGCTWHGAHIRHNWQVANQFDTYHIYSGYRYFTSGSLADPRAVLALKPGYTLTSNDWQPTDMTPEKLEQWMLALKKDSFVEYNTFSNGAQIIDAQGRIAGVYYSVWDFPIIGISDSAALSIGKPAADYRFDNERWEFLSGGDDMSLD